MTLEQVQEWMAGLNEAQLWEIVDALIFEFAAREKVLIVFLKRTIPAAAPKLEKP